MLLDKLNGYSFYLSKTAFARHLLPKAIALLAALQLSACINSVEAQRKTEYLTSSADVSTNIDRFIGETINVRNDVLETIGDRGLILDGDRLLQDKSVLVISLDKLPSFDLSQTPEILITGKASRLNLDRLEADYSLYLDRNLYANYEGQPVIIANSLILSPDPEDLSNNPEKYYGKSLAIAGEVEDITDYGVFELDEESVFGGEDLLVMQTEAKVELHDGQNVLVFGVLKPLVIDDLEHEYRLNWSQSTKQQFQTEYQRESVFMTEKIQFLQ